MFRRECNLSFEVNKKSIEMCFMYYSVEVCLVGVGGKEEDIGQLEQEKLFRD